MLKKKYSCYDSNGKELFFITLFDDPAEIVMSLQYSLPEDKIMNKDVIRTANCIRERLVTDKMREEGFVPELFKYIKKIPGIEKYYLDNSSE